MTIQRSKEIGIRKVLGASMMNIVTLLSTDFFLLIALASVVTMPISYYGLKNWLGNYAYQVEIHWWIMGLPVLLVGLFALLTVSLQTVKTALESPVNSLRSE